MLINFKQYKILESDWLALRVLISVVVAFSIGSTFELERNYWAVLTILSVNITMHWGDLFYRSWSRISMTVLGCLLGTVIYQSFFADGHTLILLLMVIITAALTVYFTLTSYTISMFANSLFVVMFFASLGDWSEQMLTVRIYETLLGATISLMVAILIRPKLSEKKIHCEIQQLWTEQKQFFRQLESNLELRVLNSQILRKKQRGILFKLSNSKKGFMNSPFSNRSTKTLSIMEDAIQHYQRWLDLWLQMSRNGDNKTFTDIIREDSLNDDSEMTGSLKHYLAYHKLNIHEEILLKLYQNLTSKMKEISLLI